MVEDNYSQKDSAAECLRMARMARAQASVTAHKPTARVLMRIAEEWTEKARQLGWEPEIPDEPQR
jgi:hypothetical protein